MIETRLLSRSDRDQVARLVNAHIAAVLPGVAVPTAALLGQLEREPGEYIVDPWVVERQALVAVQRERVVAAASLKRYGNDAARITESYCDAVAAAVAAVLEPGPAAGLDQQGQRLGSPHLLGTPLGSCGNDHPPCGGGRVLLQFDAEVGEDVVKGPGTGGRVTVDSDREPHPGSPPGCLPVTVEQVFGVGQPRGKGAERWADGSPPGGNTR